MTNPQRSKACVQRSDGSGMRTHTYVWERVSRYDPPAELTPPHQCPLVQARSLNHKLCRLGMSERCFFDFIRTL